MRGLQVIYEAMICPVCGYQLDYKPWDNNSASLEICTCCGTQFGYDDATPDDRIQHYAALREKWKNQGYPWKGSAPCPQDYEPERQLEQLSRMPKFRRGDLVKLNNDLAVIVGITGDENVPEDHVALWYGTTKENRPVVWTVPEEHLVEADQPIFLH